MDTVESVIYGPPKLAHAPARQWSVSAFRAVNDQVRGGSSTSSMTIVGKPMLPPTDIEKAERSVAVSHVTHKGEIIFDGFLGECDRHVPANVSGQLTSPRRHDYSRRRRLCLAAMPDWLPVQGGR